MEGTKSNTTRNILIGIVVLTLIGIGLTSALAVHLLAGRLGASLVSVRVPRNWSGPWILSPARVSAEREIADTFEIGNGGRLDVDLEIGDVRVEATDADAIVVAGRISARGRDEADAEANLKRVRFEMKRDGQTIRIESDTDAPVGGWHDAAPVVDVTVQVPRRTALALTVDVGDVRVEGTSSDADIQTQVGRVVVRDVAVAHRLSVQTSVAEIEFDGALVDGAEYTFHSGVGAISLRLPSDSSYGLDARSGLGAVDVDFHVDGSDAQPPLGRTVRGAVNGGGDTTVTAESDIGAVFVHGR
jgi:hypothetical protein